MNPAVPNSFSVLPAGQESDGIKYTVKDETGNQILSVFDLSHGQPQTSLLVNNGHSDVLKLSHVSPGIQFEDASGNVIGSISTATKAVKEHKEDKPGKDKRKIVLSNTTNHPLLTMTTKKGKDGNMKISIKSKKDKKLAESMQGMDLEHKDTNKKDKDKKEKDKEHKDAKEKDNEGKDSKDKKDKESKDTKDKKDKDAKDKKDKETKDTKDKEGKDTKDKKDKEGKDAKDKDEGNKHTEKKEKDGEAKCGKDKVKKPKGIAEISGSVASGLQVRINQVNLPDPERINLLGLILSYMELEKIGAKQTQPATEETHS